MLWTVVQKSLEQFGKFLQCKRKTTWPLEDHEICLVVLFEIKSDSFARKNVLYSDQESVLYKDNLNFLLSKMGTRTRGKSPEQMKYEQKTNHNSLNSIEVVESLSADIARILIYLSRQMCSNGPLTAGIENFTEPII